MPHYIVSLLKSYRREKKKRARNYHGDGEAIGNSNEVTIDASFRDKTQIKPGEDGIVHAKAGGAAIVKNRHGVRSILINNLDHEQIGTSHDAEVINAIVTLESLPPGHVRRIVCDASSLSRPMKMILREGRSADTGLNGHHDRLVDAMARHPDLTVRRMNRNRGNIRIADAFAKCVTLDDMDRLKDQIALRVADQPEVIFTGPAKETLQQRFAEQAHALIDAIEIAAGIDDLEGLDVIEIVDGFEGMAPA